MLKKKITANPNIQRNKTYHNYVFTGFILPVLSGILLSISALPSNLWMVSFIAFIPLLIAAQSIRMKKRAVGFFMLQLLITLTIFYLWVGFWILRTANFGFLIGLIIVIPFILFLTPYIILLKKNSSIAPIFFIAAWITAEFIQNYFELGSPLYALGNNPGKNIHIIQWYEYTGVTGGTLWILIVNFLLFSFIRSFTEKTNRWKKKAVSSFLSIFVPVLISVIIFYTYKEKGESYEVIVIHPNTDNRDVKYQLNIYDLLDIYLGIALPEITEKTEYVVLPETAITNTGWVEDFNQNLVFQRWFQKTAHYPKLKLITGAITYEAIPNAEKIKHRAKIPGIRYSKKYQRWYYTYNAALQLEAGQPIQMRTKEGLVPFQEYAPYPTILPRLLPVGIDFQFSSKKENQTIFTAANSHKTAALICYELAFEDKFYKAVREDAEAFFVLLNEGWYNNINVSKQFLQLSAIRAIECRRDIAHSSNKGISAFINQRGEVTFSTERKAPLALKQKIKMNKKNTIFMSSKRYFRIITIIVLLGILIRAFIRKDSTFL